MATVKFNSTYARKSDGVQMFTYLFTGKDQAEEDNYAKIQGSNLRIDPVSGKKLVFTSRALPENVQLEMVPEGQPYAGTLRTPATATQTKIINTAAEFGNLTNVTKITNTLVELRLSGREAPEPAPTPAVATPAQP